MADGHCSSPLAVGSFVMLHSLNARAELNGLVGSVEGAQNANGRQPVRLPPTVSKHAMLLKPQNLELLVSPTVEIPRLVSTKHAEEVRERVRAAADGVRDGSGGRIVLDLEHTGLGEVPASIGALGSMVEEVWLGGNDRLQRLPAALTGLHQVQLLDVDACALRELPSSLGLLRALRSLYANDNQLCALPASMSQLCELSDLRLSGNRLGAAARDVGAAARGASSSGGDVCAYVR